MEEDRERSKKAASKMLKEALERDPVVWGTCYVVTQPSAHAGHAMGEMVTNNSLLTKDKNLCFHVKLQVCYI